jgi:hypothetical protein
MNFLLPALLAVRPLTEESAAIVRATNPMGFYLLNGPLLLKNGSPLALAVFEEMVVDTSVDLESRVEMIHHAVLPLRGDSVVVGLCIGLIRRGVEAGIENGLIETLYDHQSRLWFGVVRVPPTPPAWADADPEARRMLIEFGRTLLAARRHPIALMDAVERVLLELDLLESSDA